MTDDAEEEEELAIAANAESEKIRQKALKGKLRIGKSGSIASVAGSEKRIVFKEDGTASKPLEALGEDAKFFVANTAANDHALRETVKRRMKKLPKNVNPRITPIVDAKRRDCERSWRQA